jgi:hypothetical protein
MTPPDFSQPVSGPAYGSTFRALATLMLVAVLVMGARAAMNVPAGDAGAQGYTIIGLGVLAIAGSYWVMIASTTTIDATGLRQSGLTEKKVSWSELYSARLFGPPFARRLMVRTTNGRFRFFFGGSPELIEAFARIAQAYRR